MMSWGNAVVVGVALAVGVVASRARPSHAVTEPRSVTEHALVVPTVEGAPELDGELGDAIWRGAVARTGPFLDANGAAARPYSDARAVVVRDELIVALYVADEDIRTSGPLRDVLRVTLGSTTFEVSATGELRGAPSGTRIGHDLDGTPDDPSDDDEEWVIELAIPLASLGLHAPAGETVERVPFAVDRCDTTHDGARACSRTRNVLVLTATR